MPTVRPITRRDLVTLALIVLVGAYVRLNDPGVVEFKHDEAWLSLYAQDVASGMRLHLTGIPSSVGLPNPPISVYVMAIPYVLSNSAIVATMFVAALNVAGVGLLWLLGFRYINRTVALAAGLAYALSPWAVLYSRKIWAQDLHTPFVLAALLLGLYGFIEGRRWAQIVCLPVLLFALQIHFAAWALLPLYIYLLWAGRRRVAWQAVTISIALGVLVCLPYAVGLAQTLNDDPDRLANAATGSDGAAVSDIVSYPAWLGTGLGIETQVAPEASDALLEAVPPQPQLWSLLGLLTVVGAIVMLSPQRLMLPRGRQSPAKHRADSNSEFTGNTVVTARFHDTTEGKPDDMLVVENSQGQIGGLVVLWAVLPSVVFLPGWTTVYPHYFIASIPAYLLLAGVAVAWIAARLPGQPLSRTVVLTAFCAILLTQAVWWRGLVRYVATTPTEGFGLALGYREPLRNALLAYDDVVIVTGDARLAYSQEPAIWSSLLYHPARCVRALDDRPMLVLPDGPFAALYTPDAPNEAAYRSEAEQQFTLGPDAQVFTLYNHPSGLDSAPDVEGTIDAPFANGARLTDYKIDDERVWLIWQLPGRTDDQAQYFVHLLDANGDRVAQHDADFLPGRYWCDGDRLLTWSDITVPEEVVTLRVGLYRLRSAGFENIPVNGNPWVDIGLSAQ